LALRKFVCTTALFWSVLALCGEASAPASANTIPDGNDCYGRIQAIDRARRRLTFVYALDGRRYQIRVTDDTEYYVYANRGRMKYGGGHFQRVNLLDSAFIGFARRGHWFVCIRDGVATRVQEDAGPE